MNTPKALSQMNWIEKVKEFSAIVYHAALMSIVDAEQNKMDEVKDTLRNLFANLQVYCTANNLPSDEMISAFFIEENEGYLHRPVHNCYSAYSLIDKMLIHLHNKETRVTVQVSQLMLRKSRVIGPLEIFWQSSIETTHSHELCLIINLPCTDYLKYYTVIQLFQFRIAQQRSLLTS